MSNIFDIQPDWCRKPLEYKEINWTGSSTKEHYDQIAFFDPMPIYERIYDRLNPYRRIQGMSIRRMFPNDDGQCACGCDKELTGRRTRWATKKCSYIPVTIYNIICGRTTTIYYYLRNYYGHQCANCDRSEEQIHEEEIKDLPHWHNRRHVDVFSVDHILPVKHGGGGSWLSNFQLLCHKCHVEKTKEDFGWGQKEKLRQRKELLLKTQIKLKI